MANNARDPLDINQDNRVTKDEIDTAAGSKPGVFTSAPKGAGFWGKAANVASNLGWAATGPGLGVHTQARQDDWGARRNTLYQKYGITAGATGGAQTKYAAPGPKTTAAGTAAPQYPAGLQGTYPGQKNPLSKAPFPTLGVTQGLIDAGIVREQMGPTGDLVYVTPRQGGESVVMQYKAQDAYLHLAEMDEEQLGNFRRAMYISGYGTPTFWAGPLSTSDLDLMVQAMTDANMAGGTWDEVVNRRVEAGGRYARPLTMYEAAIESGDTASVLKQYAQRNGIVLSDSFIANQQRSVAQGEIEMEDLLTLIKETYVKTLYPAFAAEVDQGLTVEDLAGPWRSYLAETFGVKEDQISLFDPLLQAAMQNFDPHGQASKTSMNQFAEMVHEDPRWEYSPDAWNKIGLAMDQLSAGFGAGTQYQAPTVGYGGGPMMGGSRG